MTYDVEGFYYLARADPLVKDERHIDRFDQVFFARLQGSGGRIGRRRPSMSPNLPEDWTAPTGLRSTSRTQEKKLVESLGGFEKLMETLKQRLEEQKGPPPGRVQMDRHRRGPPPPFGAYGYNPEGVRNRPGRKPAPPCCKSLGQARVQEFR